VRVSAVLLKEKYIYVRPTVDTGECG